MPDDLQLIQRSVWKTDKPVVSVDVTRPDCPRPLAAVRVRAGVRLDLVAVLDCSVDDARSDGRSPCCCTVRLEYRNGGPPASVSGVLTRFSDDGRRMYCLLTDHDELRLLVFDTTDGRKLVDRQAMKEFYVSRMPVGFEVYDGADMQASQRAVHFVYSEDIIREPWDRESGGTTAPLKGKEPFAVTYWKTGRECLAWLTEGSLQKMHSPTSNNQRQVFTPFGLHWPVDYSAKENKTAWMVCAGDVCASVARNTVYLWNVRRRNHVDAVLGCDARQLTSLNLLKRGGHGVGYVVALADDDCLRVWDCKSESVIGSYRLPDGMQSKAALLVGRSLVVRSSADNEVGIYDVANVPVLATMSAGASASAVSSARDRHEDVSLSLPPPPPPPPAALPSSAAAAAAPLSATTGMASSAAPPPPPPQQFPHRPSKDLSALAFLNDPFASTAMGSMPANLLPGSLPRAPSATQVPVISHTAALAAPGSAEPFRRPAPVATLRDRIAALNQLNVSMELLLAGLSGAPGAAGQSMKSAEVLVELARLMPIFEVATSGISQETIFLESATDLQLFSALKQRVEMSIERLLGAARPGPGSHAGPGVASAGNGPAAIGGEPYYPSALGDTGSHSNPRKRSSATAGSADSVDGRSSEGPVQHTQSRLSPFSSAPSVDLHHGPAMKRRL